MDDTTGVPPAYVAAVETRFIALRGKGLMLSPRDVAIVQAWEEAGVPLRVVLRAIDEGLERFRRTHPPDAPLPSTLGYFRTWVDKAVHRRRQNLLPPTPATVTRADSGTRGDDSDDEARDRARLLAAIATAGAAQPEGPIRIALREAWRRINGAEAEAIWTLTRQVDAHIVAAALAASGSEQREAANVAADKTVLARGGATMSARGQNELRERALAEAVRGTWNLPDLIEVLLES